MANAFADFIRNYKPNTASKLLAWLVLLKPVLQYAFDLINAASNLDFAISARGNPRMIAVWNFLNSPLGNLCFVAAGLLLLLHLGWRWSKAAAQSLGLPKTADVDSSPEMVSLNAKHESEIATLNKQIEGLTQEVGKLQRNADALQMSISSRDAELEQYAWVRDLADAQARDIDKYVIVERALLCDINLKDPVQIPYVEFWLDVINTSVYDVTVHKDTLEGRIKFRLNKLLEGKEVICLQESIPPSSRVNINIRQRLHPTEVSLLAPYDKKKEEAASFFDLSEIGVTISGGTRFPQVEAKRLTLPQFVGSNDRPSKTEPDITGKIKEVYSEWWANSELTNSKQTYFDYHFVINVYLANHGAVTTIEQFKLVLKVGEHSYDGERERDSYDVKDGEMDWREWGAGELEDLEKSNNVPLEHTRNGWLWFVVKGVPNTEDKSKMELQIYAVDKDGTSYQLDTSPQHQWQGNPFLKKAQMEEARARMRQHF